MMRPWHGLFLVGTALLLVVPDVHIAMLALLSLAGFFLVRRARGTTPITDAGLLASWRVLLGGFAVFAVTGLLINLYHGVGNPGAYERLLPFFFVPAMAWTIRAGGWTALPWIAAIGLAAALTGGHAVWEYLSDPSLRAEGGTGNAIKFGNSAVILAGLSTFAALLYPFPSRPSLWRGGLLLAALAAALASVLSSSKGGWPVLLMIAVVAVYTITRSRPPWQRLALAAGALALLMSIALLAPTLVQDRIVAGVGAAIHWFRSGGEVTDGSVSLRFELWSLGLRIFTENPILGAGSENLDARWAELVATEPRYAVIGPTTSAHNDMIDALANGGIVGGLTQALAYLGVWLAFWRWRHHPDGVVMALSRMGLFLAPAYLVFGLSVSVFGISIFRTVMAGLSVTLLALLSVRIRTLERERDGS